MSNEPDEDDDKGWFPRERNLDAVLWWALGLVVVVFVTLSIFLH